MKILKSKKLVFFGVFAIIAALTIFVQACTTNTAGNATLNTNLQSPNYEGEQVKLDFYVMSQCPYGTQVVDAIAPVKQELGAALDLNINYIANDLGNGQYKSLHGQNEVQGDIVQLCAMKYNPEKYLDMVVCQNQNAQQIPANWESCAQQKGLNVEDIKTCYEGDEGKDLLTQSIQESSNAGASASPTIYLNGQQYVSGRKTTDFLRAVCNEFQDKPEACNNIPEPAKVNTLIINDERCKECDITGLKAQLKSVFPGIIIKELDYGNAKGKELFNNLDLGVLPAVLFDDSVKQAESYSGVQPYLVQAGDYYNLRIGASFDPTAEICDNNIDDTNNGKIDCQDDTCKDTLVCREEKPENLKVFIMSDCPYGKKAIEALKDVNDNFDSLDFEVHYIASETANGFSSLHGQYEVDEDIVQLCVKENSPDQWFDYLYCRSVNGIKGKGWKDCATETGVDIEAVQTCSEGDEGAQLLRDDIKIAQGLKISASPTWLANNRHLFSGIDAETVKTNYCTYNDVAGCENALSADTGGVPAGSC